MSKFWNKKTNEIEAYVAGEQPKTDCKLVKLNTNENPYSPSKECEKVLKEFDIQELRLYPDTDSTIVRDAVAKITGLERGNVFVGNGSDEVLAICWQAFFEKKYNTNLGVLVPEVSYSFYPVYAQNYDTRLIKIPLGEDLSIDPDDFCVRENCGVAIANPNAPTSIAMPIADIERILQANPDSVVIIDEAYAAFKTKYESAAELVNKYPNLVVVQTLSKSYGLAGLRVGYAVASKELIEGMIKIRDSFNSYPVDRIAQKVAAAAILDMENYEINRLALIGTRTNAMAEFRKMGFFVPESSANFIFVKPPVEITAESLYNKLRQKGILVRYFNKPIVKEFLRISIGTDEEMSIIVEAIKEELKNA